MQTIPLIFSTLLIKSLFSDNFQIFLCLSQDINTSLWVLVTFFFTWVLFVPCWASFNTVFASFELLVYHLSSLWSTCDPGFISTHAFQHFSCPLPHPNLQGASGQLCEAQLPAGLNHENPFWCPSWVQRVWDQESFDWRMRDTVWSCYSYWWSGLAVGLACLTVR